MQIMDFSINEWVTILVVIAQAGITYHRLKRVEQSTERFHDLFTEFAVYKNAFNNHMRQFEKQSAHVERIIERLENKISCVEMQTYKTLMKNSHSRKPA